MSLAFPYDPDRFPAAPKAEKTVVQVFNQQWFRLAYLAPELRRDYRYLERGEMVPTQFGMVFMQAGAIIHKDRTVRDHRMFSARGGGMETVGKPMGQDHLISVRPTHRKVYRRTKDGQQRLNSPSRYANITLGPRGHRGSQVVPYGWLVYVLRHPEFSGAFPLTYEPINPLIAQVETPEIRTNIKFNQIDDLWTRERGADLMAAATREVDRILATTGVIPEDIDIVVPGEATQLVEVENTQYNTYFPANLQPKLIKPTFKYEKESWNYDLWLNSPRTHYPNDFTAELNYFNLGDVDYD